MVNTDTKAMYGRKGVKKFSFELCQVKIIFQLHRCECPRGYRLDSSGKKCVDENECVERPRVCGNGTCTNLDGGFECACADGFAPGPFGNCEDVDECTEYGHQCAFR